MRRRIGWEELARLLEVAGKKEYVAALVDLVGSLVSHDRMTVTRYVVDARPEFLAHRNFSDQLARRYLETYYPFDPFHGHWSRTEATGVVPLSRFSSRELKQGRYIAEFLAQSVIRDEVGILLDDGPRATVGVFLERATRVFGPSDIARLEAAFPALASLHGLHRRLSQPARRTRLVARAGLAPVRGTAPSPRHLWPALTEREGQVIGLILAGHASRDIARKLGISPGTVRNHRLSIYTKLDITSEREVFLSYLDMIAAG